MKQLPTALRRIPSALVAVVAVLVLTPAAAMWRARASLIEIVGVAALAVFAAGLVDRGAWLVAGLGLVAKAVEIDRKARP